MFDFQQEDFNQLGIFNKGNGCMAKGNGIAKAENILGNLVASQ